MSNLQQLLKQARGKAPAKPAGNMIIKVKSFGTKTITGEIMTGPTAGQQIELIPGGKTPVEEYANLKKKTGTEIGGYLRVEGVTARDDGLYESRWARTFLGKPTEDHQVLFDQTATLVQGQSRDGRSKFARIYTLDTAAETKPTSIEAVEKAMADAFASHGAVSVFMKDAGNISSATYYLRGDTVDGKFVLRSPKDQAAEFMTHLGQEGQKIVGEIAAAGALSVVPTRSISVGNDTWANVQIDLAEAEKTGTPARISTVNPQRFEIPSLGRRLQSAVERIGDGAFSKEEKDHFQRAFLASANTVATQAFASGGYAAVADADIKSFLKGFQIEPMELPATGWGLNSLVLQKYASGENHFVAKAEPTRLVAPFPPIELCKEALTAYYSEMTEAVRAVLNHPELSKAGPAADSKGAPAAAAEKAAPAPAIMPDAFMDELMDLPADEMDLGQN